MSRIAFILIAILCEATFAFTEVKDDVAASAQSLRDALKSVTAKVTTEQTITRIVNGNQSPGVQIKDEYDVLIDTDKWDVRRKTYVSDSGGGWRQTYDHRIIIDNECLFQRTTAFRPSPLKPEMQLFAEFRQRAERARSLIHHPSFGCFAMGVIRGEGDLVSALLTTSDLKEFSDAACSDSIIGMQGSSKEGLYRGWFDKEKSNRMIKAEVVRSREQIAPVQPTLPDAPRITKLDEHLSITLDQCSRVGGIWFPNRATMISTATYQRAQETVVETITYRTSWTDVQFSPKHDAKSAFLIEKELEGKRVHVFDNPSIVYVCRSGRVQLDTSDAVPNSVGVAVSDAKRLAIGSPTSDDIVRFWTRVAVIPIVGGVCLLALAWWYRRRLTR